MNQLLWAVYWLASDNAPLTTKRLGELVLVELVGEITESAATRFAKAALVALENQGLVWRDSGEGVQGPNDDGPWSMLDTSHFPEEMRPKRP